MKLHWTWDPSRNLSPWWNGETSFRQCTGAPQDLPSASGPADQNGSRAMAICPHHRSRWPVLIFRGAHPEKAHGIPEAFSPKSVWLGEVPEDRWCHDLLGLDFGIWRNMRFKKLPGNSKHSTKMYHIVWYYHVHLLNIVLTYWNLQYVYIYLWSTFVCSMYCQSMQTPVIAATRQVLEQRTVGLGKAWQSSIWWYRNNMIWFLFTWYGMRWYLIELYGMK